MDIAKGKEKAGELLTKFIEVFKAFLAALGELCVSLIGKVGSFADRILGHFPAEKRRLILFAFGGLAALLLILMVSAIVLYSGKPKISAAAAMAAIAKTLKFF